MNRNTELHFSQTPQINIKRSKFEVSHSHKTTFNVGDIIPLMVDSDILPGDTVQMDMAELIRMATPIYPIMDNLYFDIYWFFVPHRLVWEHWAEFWGENENPWVQQTEYEIPQIMAPVGGWTEGTIADYMGIPTKIEGFTINAMPFRAYCKIWNDWFRDENLKQNCHIYKDETTRSGSNGNTYVTDAEKGGMPCKAAKMHDYFTSGLPQPQKGDPVQVPIGSIANVVFPANTRAMVTNRYEPDHEFEFQVNSTTSMHGKDGLGAWPVSYQKRTNDAITDGLHANYINWSNADNRGTMHYHKNASTESTANFDANMVPINLWANLEYNEVKLGGINGVYADLSSATAITINQLRTAFAIQKYLENAGLHGTRYIEYIRSVFGVTSSDARMQRAEYIGGTRVPINIDQILQTSSTDSVSPQGNTSGFSCTINSDSMFTKSFEEHGTLMCLGVIRTEHTYQQGLKKMWTRKKWTDFYNPFFANLGEQAILNENIYLTNNETQNKEAFAYQEAWADYRYKENFVTGYMRSNANGSLDVWHFADDYKSLPILGTTWIDEPYENVDRTIAVTSQLTHQFIADIYFKAYYTRPMPIYSIPGLIDHV